MGKISFWLINIMSLHFNEKCLLQRQVFIIFVFLWYSNFLIRWSTTWLIFYFCIRWLVITDTRPTGEAKLFFPEKYIYIYFSNYKGLKNITFVLINFYSAISFNCIISITNSSQELTKFCMQDLYGKETKSCKCYDTLCKGDTLFS